jgi:hypothetical protein
MCFEATRTTRLPRATSMRSRVASDGDSGYEHILSKHRGLAITAERLRPHRPTDARPDPRGHRLRCSQDGGEMSRNCRHMSEAVQSKRQVSTETG